MRTIGNCSKVWQILLVAVWFMPSIAGCGGTSNPPAAKSTVASPSLADDPDVYKPLIKPSQSPPPPTRQSSNADSSKKAALSDPDAYVPEKPLTRPATQAKNDQNKENGLESGGSSERPLPSLPPAKPGEGKDIGFDPDVYVPETEQPIIAGKKTGLAKNGKSETHSLSLEARLRLYQSEKTDVATQTALEMDFLSESREAILVVSGFNVQPTAPPRKSDGLDDFGRLLWNRPFIDFLDLQLQSLTTLSQRPTAVALAALTPNDAMRADLRRTLSRHWHEGPKAIRTAAAADYPLAEPGFITVLKSLIRKNYVRSTPKPDSNWNSLLEELLRDYCRRCHMASLARSAAAFREGAVSPNANSTLDSTIPQLPGYKMIASHRFEWPGENASRLPRGTENYLSLDYQRFEKRTSMNKPLLFYRRQVTSCIEHSMPSGIWLDGFIDRKDEHRVRSIDILISRPKTDDMKPATEEMELTVEILCIGVRKTDL